MLMMMPRRASVLRWVALAGMAVLWASCAGPGRPVVRPDDERLDRVWLAVRRGHADGARRAAAEVADPVFARRARLDALAVEGGRVAALTEAGHSWHAARFDASAVRARRRLARELRRDRSSAAAWLEWARRATTPDERRTGAWEAERVAPGHVEARLWGVEADLQAGDLEAADEGLAELEETHGELARVRWARRRWQRATGRVHAAALGVLDDLAAGVAIPAGVATLVEGVLAQVDAAAVDRALEALAAADGVDGTAWHTERLRGLAELHAARGEWARAADALERAGPRDPFDDRRIARWRDAAAGRLAPLDPERVAALRLAGAWRHLATASYRDVVDGAASRDLDAFVAFVDRAADQIPDAPRLAWLPRVTFGLVGEMLDTSALRKTLPGAFVVGGKALGLPSDVTWYDEVDAVDVDVVLDEGAASYRRHLVREPRVPGALVWSGRAITGAGLYRTVFLDVDRIAGGLRRPPEASLAAPPAPRPVGGPLDIDRFDVAEPLDVADRLRAAVRAEAGGAEAYEALAIDEIAVHEERHILDAQGVLSGSTGDLLGLVLDVGVLPRAVRAGLERRAQLHALREARAPRLALASIVDMLPVEGAALDSEHAVGYRDVLAAFLDVLDREAWPGARPLDELGIRRDHVLLHQLPRLDGETIRAIARAIPD